MSPIAVVAGDTILDLVLGQVEGAFVAEFFPVRLTHQHDFVEEENVTIPLSGVLIFVSFDAQNAVSLQGEKGEGKEWFRILLTEIRCYKQIETIPRDNWWINDKPAIFHNR